MYELLGQRSYFMCTLQAQSCLQAVLRGHPHQQVDHQERTLRLICDVCHVHSNKFASVSLTRHSSYIIWNALLPFTIRSLTAASSKNKADPFTVVFLSSPKDIFSLLLEEGGGGWERRERREKERERNIDVRNVDWLAFICTQMQLTRVRMVSLGMCPNRNQTCDVSVCGMAHPTNWATHTLARASLCFSKPSPDTPSHSEESPFLYPKGSQLRWPLC